ncbi:unnamed protein product [Aspergillus oryzae]|nr:unnamed protein product [Aspergillus oryzae]GMF85246.1 unnamed protein product [Aspergillus oryzae]GMG05726.1 unnamed protein product [Aspergillus oryzae]
MGDTKDNVISEQSSVHDDRKDNTLHYASRGQALSDESTGAGDIAGFDAEWMRARTSLTADEEKKLLRRVDWHIMPLCAIMFLLKNIDSENLFFNYATGIGLMRCRYDCFTFVSELRSSDGFAALTEQDILGNFSGIISGVLAYAFDTVSGSHGLSGWQCLVDTDTNHEVTVPPQAKWLTDKEKAFIQARLPGNAPRAEEINFNFREILDSLRDRRLWLFTLIWAFFTVGTHGLRFYQPTVIANLGFTYVPLTCYSDAKLTQPGTLQHPSFSTSLPPSSQSSASAFSVFGLTAPVFPDLFTHCLFWPSF